MKRIERAALLLSLLLSGCFPYDAHFLCEKSNDYGRCTSVQGAYGDAIRADGTTGEVVGSDGDAESASANAAAAAPGANRDGAPKPPTATAHDRYKDSEYRTMAGLINAPVAPVVTPPKVLRTLVVAYSTDQSLYMPRYVFYIADESHFVLGDYLNQIPLGGPTIYPNGADPAGRH